MIPTRHWNVTEEDRATQDSFWAAFDWSQRDVRVDGWPMMGSYYPTLLVCIAYVFGAKVVGPRLMHDRPALQLRLPMSVYNFGQFVAHFAMMRNWFVIYWHLEPSWCT